MSKIRSTFEEQGYYLAKDVFTPGEMAALERDFDRIVGQLAASGEPIDATWEGAATARLAAQDDVIIHTHNVQKYSRTWLNAFLNERFLDVVGPIIGDDIILHHSKLFQKPQSAGSPFPMHQDWPYFPTVNDSMVAAIIHVSAATDDMGCLRVYPGSHRLGRIAGANGRQPNEVLDRYPIDSATVIEAEAGDVVLFHYLTLHGSMPNRSARTRKTVLCQMYNGRDRVEDGNQHPNEGMVLRGWNHQMTRDVAAV